MNRGRNRLHLVTSISLKMFFRGKALLARRAFPRTPNPKNSKFLMAPVGRRTPFCRQNWGIFMFCWHKNDRWWQQTRHPLPL
jgi:hypothetical protein